MTGLEPARNAVKVEGMIALTPENKNEQSSCKVDTEENNATKHVLEIQG